MHEKNRKSIRLPGYDYAGYGWYFVTVCVKNMAECFGEVRNGVMKLNQVGEVVQREWLRTPQLRPNVELDEFIVMPNHLHGIIIIKRPSIVVGAYCNTPLHVGDTPLHGERDDHLKSPSQTLGAIMRGFKSSTAAQINKQLGLGSFAWQRNYYERIIRNDLELEHIRAYIRNNPLHWDLDEENLQHKRDYSVFSRA
jgi:REP element-mobilizing transposase RayT